MQVCLERGEQECDKSTLDTKASSELMDGELKRLARLTQSVFGGRIRLRLRHFVYVHIQKDLLCPINTCLILTCY